MLDTKKIANVMSTAVEQIRRTSTCKDPKSNLQRN